MHEIKKVVFFISELGGGVTRYSLNHAKELQKKGISVYIFNNCTKWNEEINDFEGLPFFNVHLSSDSFKKRLYELNLFIYDTSFICTEGHELDFFYKNRLKFHIVYILHGEYSYYINNAIKYIGIIDSICCVSKSIYTRLKENPLIYFKERVFYIPHRLEKLHNRSLNNKEKNTIAFIGRPTREKGFDIILELLQKLEGQNLLFKWYFFGFEKPRSIDINMFRSELKFYGQLNHAELLNRLMTCQFLILPSTHEGLPLSVLESMNCSVIPICNLFNGGINEFVHHEKNGYIIKDNNIDEYEKLLIRLYNSNLLSSSNEYNMELLKPFYTASIDKLLTQKNKVMYYVPLQKFLLKLINLS